MRPLVVDVGLTLVRAAAGTALAVAVGGPLGLWLGLGRRAGARWRRRLAGAAERLVDGLRSTPPIAVYPLLLVLLGQGEGARLLTVMFGAAGLVALEVGAGVARAPAARREVARAMGASPLRCLLWIDAFEAVPGLVTGARAAFSVALIVVLVSEMLMGAEAGLGLRLVEATLRFDTGALVAAVAVIGAVGALASAVVAGLGRALMRWAGVATETP